ncbi:MAG: holo-ACP synthase [Ruaniaceae bacterium]|nr:holo-ACP synthase [Ruaniaceae bacterium]
MIVGIGVDVASIARVSEALARQPRLAERLFTETERALPPESLAARFAAKEAVAKALGSPGGMRWRDCEVVTEADGAPHLVLTGTVAEAARARGVRSWHLSLSHDGGLAIAMVVAES